MIFVEICGGLGNQLFQYAVARKLKEVGKEVYLDLSWFNKYDEREYLLDRYPISMEKINGKVWALWKAWNGIPLYRRNHSYLEKSYSLDEEIFKIDNVILKGYWQSEKYFDDIRTILLKELTLDYLFLPERCKAIYNEMKQCCSVAVHIRRGDYLEERNRASRGGICTKYYYHKAMEWMRNSSDLDVRFFFFSDDIEWVKENYIGRDIFYVDIAAPHEEIWLMSQCRHNIIANSSFSWWGAWLNGNVQQRVIAPSKWKNGKNIENIYCKDWMQVEG